MSLSVGIVGLPNAGKSTLFNALLGRQIAQVGEYPFTTIKENTGVVEVPDENLEKLAAKVEPEKVVPAAIKFIDIAGLVKGSHQGEGLGNQFLAKIREVTVVVHVVRLFANPNVAHVHTEHEVGTAEQAKYDIEVINHELIQAGIEKPVIYVLNVDEKQLAGESVKQLARKVGEQTESPVIPVAAKLEEEMADLSLPERREYLAELGVVGTGLDRLIKESFRLLGLITFYTIKGGRQVQAWPIKSGKTALEAAEIVHTDFAQGFIKAEVCPLEKLLAAGSWKAAQEQGLVELKGKDYLVRDQDVIEFKAKTG